MINFNDLIIRRIFVDEAFYSVHEEFFSIIYSSYTDMELTRLARLSSFALDEN